jgi:DNA-binding NtrC family response regulator
MKRNDWVDSPVPVSTPAPRALHLLTQPASLDAGSARVVKALMVGRPIKDVLVVDPTLELQETVQNILRSVAIVHSCTTFEDARRRLISRPPDLLVTSVRLHAHNGLHLVHLAARNPRTRSIVHLTAEDFALTRDAEAAGALVVREPWLVVAIESIVLATLRRKDRRDPITADRHLGEVAPMRGKTAAGS